MVEKIIIVEALRKIFQARSGSVKSMSLTTNGDVIQVTSNEGVTHLAFSISPTTNTPHHTDRTGIIVGATVAGAVILIVAIATIVIIVRRKSHTQGADNKCKPNQRVQNVTSSDKCHENNTHGKPQYNSAFVISEMDLSGKDKSLLPVRTTSDSIQPGPEGTDRPLKRVSISAASTLPLRKPQRPRPPVPKRPKGLELKSLPTAAPRRPLPPLHSQPSPWQRPIHTKNPTEEDTYMPLSVKGLKKDRAENRFSIYTSLTLPRSFGATKVKAWNDHVEGNQDSEEGIYECINFSRKASRDETTKDLTDFINKF